MSDTEREDEARMVGELGALLAGERARTEEAPREVLARVRGRLGPAMGAPAPGAGGGGLTASGIKLAALTFVLGGVVGAGLHAALRPPATVVVERPAEPRVVEAVPASPPAPVVREPPVNELAASAKPRAVAAPSASTSTLEAERALLDRARTALAAGDGASALTLLEQHAKAFASPRLGEEREALAVQALVTSGRYDAARARAARFRERTPSSIFQPAIDASLASIPTKEEKP